MRAPGLVRVLKVKRVLALVTKVERERVPTREQGWIPPLPWVARVAAPVALLRALPLVLLVQLPELPPVARTVPRVLLRVPLPEQPLAPLQEPPVVLPPAALRVQPVLHRALLQGPRLVRPVKQPQDLLPALQREVRPANKGGLTHIKLKNKWALLRFFGQGLFFHLLGEFMSDNQPHCL